ncbi:MAG TPA: hypothetical protein PKW79_07345, partial [Rhabdochlamydiaceae bacterium]|nr:hypothetical protein [Rhabdochlamydiaceae bacterium]
KTGDWGVKINNTEIRELHPPEDVMRSIENLFKATLESEAALTKSETQAESLRKLFEIGSQIDNRTFLLRYLETLEKVGNGTSAKYLIPFEFFQKLEAWIEAEDHLAEKPKANNTPNNNLLNPSQRLKNG